jgi:hypothetical protein
MRSWKGGFWLASVVALLVLAAPAQAATDVYPEGGGEFNGGAEGWQVTGASCDVPAVCAAGGGYDGTDGSPAGSLGVDTSIGLNLLSLFHSTVTLQSPDFKVGAAGAATLHLERRFDPGSLIDLAPQLNYSVHLVDRTSSKHSTAISEVIEGGSGWLGEDGAATVKAGHTYAILITARTASTVAGTGLLAGATKARFDNVALAVHRSGASGNGTGSGTESGSGAGSGSLSDARLTALAPATVSGPAQLQGKRLLVKARCPKKVGHACRISLLGLLKKNKAATAKRTVKVAKGKTKRLVLKVKPRAKGKVAARKRLLFKVKVRAGGAQATAYKRLRLIRR